MRQVDHHVAVVLLPCPCETRQMVVVDILDVVDVADAKDEEGRHTPRVVVTHHHDDHHTEVVPMNNFHVAVGIADACLSDVVDHRILLFRDRQVGAYHT